MCLAWITCNHLNKNFVQDFWIAWIVSCDNSYINCHAPADKNLCTLFVKTCKSNVLKPNWSVNWPMALNGENIVWMVYTEICSTCLSWKRPQKLKYFSIIYPIMIQFCIGKLESSVYDISFSLPNRITTSTNTKAHAHQHSVIVQY